MLDFEKKQIPKTFILRSKSRISRFEMLTVFNVVENEHSYCFSMQFECSSFRVNCMRPLNLLFKGVHYDISETGRLGHLLNRNFVETAKC